ncbi:MAG: archease [Chloroflexi bacterium]|nr:archease [Chloroflexota bacterium]
MKESQTSGYEEIEHTADCQVRVWGKDLSFLLMQAAISMNTLIGMALKPEPRLTRNFSLSFSDIEELLVSFLNELLFFIEMEGIGFDQFKLSIDDHQLDAIVYGAPIASLRKEIKAVTYHNLKIENTSHGLEAHIVFDV